MMTTAQKTPADLVADAEARLKACMDATAAAKAKLTPPLGDDPLGQLRFQRGLDAATEAFRDAELAELEARQVSREAQAKARTRRVEELRPRHQARIDRVSAALDAAADEIEQAIDAEAADASAFNGQLPWVPVAWAELDRRNPDSRFNTWKRVLRGEGFRVR